MAAISTTTLSSAITSDDQRVVTPASMTGIVLGDILFIGREAMQVQVLGTTTVDVQRGIGGTRAANHIASDRVYHGPPNQFEQRDPRGDETPDDTPWINIMNASIWSRGRNDIWRRWSDGGRAGNPLFVYTEPGAISVEQGTHVLNGDGADAMTLAAPSVDQDGMELYIVSNAAQAFVVTATSLLRGDSGGTDDTTATYSAIGDSMTLVAYAGIWFVKGTGTASGGVVLT